MSLQSRDLLKLFGGGAVMLTAAIAHSPYAERLMHFCMDAIA